MTSPPIDQSSTPEGASEGSGTGGPGDRLLSVAEVAEHLRRAPRTIRRWIRAGWLRPVRGEERTVGILESELRRALRRRQRRL